MNDNNEPTDETKDRAKQAMSRQIAKKPNANDCDDKMTEAMTENREGVNAKEVDEDQQIKAMTNEFELDRNDTEGSDKMTEAMKETRIVAKKDN